MSFDAHVKKPEVATGPLSQKTDGDLQFKRECGICNDHMFQFIMYDHDCDKI